MNEVQPIEKSRKKLQVILIIAIVVISSGAVIGITLSLELTNQGPTGPVITKTYSGITAENASILANDETIIIVDVRSCKCRYNSAHLPNATWETDWTIYYNETKDILVYDDDETESIQYCEQLINHTYGAIYYLKGGINSWKNAGYPTE